MAVIDESVPLTKKNIEVILNYIPYFEDKSQNFLILSNLKKKKDELLIIFILHTQQNLRNFIEYYMNRDLSQTSTGLTLVKNQTIYPIITIF